MAYLSCTLSAQQSPASRVCQANPSEGGDSSPQAASPGPPCTCALCGPRPWNALTLHSCTSQTQDDADGEKLPWSHGRYPGAFTDGQWWKLGSSCRGPGKHPEGIRKFLGSAIPLLDVHQLVILRSGSGQMCASKCVGQGRSEHHPGGHS